MAFSDPSTSSALPLDLTTSVFDSPVSIPTAADFVSPSDGHVVLPEKFINFLIESDKADSNDTLLSLVLGVHLA